MQAIRKAIKSDGTWLIADIHGMPTFEENLKQNPLAPLMWRGIQTIQSQCLLLTLYASPATIRASREIKPLHFSKDATRC
jgi:hypothetical protein